MHPTKIEISGNTRSALIELLQARLFDAADLASRCKQAHWNVKGVSFRLLHDLFDELHTEALQHADLIAERIVTLGGTATGLPRQVAAGTTLPVYPQDATSQEAHIDAMSASLATFGKYIREAISRKRTGRTAVGRDR